MYHNIHVEYVKWCSHIVYLQQLNYDSSHPESQRGVFTTRAQLDAYERLWHSCVYKPSHNELSQKVNVHCMQTDAFLHFTCETGFFDYCSAMYKLLNFTTCSLLTTLNNHNTKCSWISGTHILYLHMYKFTWS